MTRETAREALVTLYTNTGAFTVVNGCVPLTLNGATKIVNVSAGPSRLDRISADLKNNFHTFYVDTLVKRRGTAADEDDMDAMHEAVVGVAVANPQHSEWSHLEMDEETEPRFVQGDGGTQYKMERHKVKVKLTG